MIDYLNKKKYFIETFGCQMNEFDSGRISKLLESSGYENTINEKNADIIVFNTCSVREKAENKLFGHLGNLKTLKKNKPETLICVGGCTAQNLKDKIFNDFPYVDIVFGTDSINKLQDLIDKKKSLNRSICDVEQYTSIPEIYNFKRTSNFKTFIPITIGCNNYCSYCIVPYVRGREKSVAYDLIIKTVKNLALDGVIDITLLGQNVNSYGKDLDNSPGFAALLEEISKITGLEIIRFMTSHPKDFSKNIIETIKNHENIAKHIHLPLQAGSDRVLNLMNRKYSKEDYIKIFKTIKDELPDCSITTDIIVGFPGETEKDFSETIELVKQLRFNRAFTFIYSRRNNTKAAIMPDPVPSEEKKTWFKELVNTQNKISLEENKKLSGSKVKVLVECMAKKKESKLEGRMENNLTVIFSGTDELIGRIVEVEILEARTFYLIGKISPCF
jgi:tRNA-2-methylthio-N6-dimethylallyladenosine synthase